MKISATCSSCGKPLKTVHLALPVHIESHATTITPTLNNCPKCGARGAYIAEFKEPAYDGK